MRVLKYETITNKGIKMDSILKIFMTIPHTAMKIFRKRERYVCRNPHIKNK